MIVSTLPRSFEPRTPSNSNLLGGALFGMASSSEDGAQRSRAASDVTSQGGDDDQELEHMVRMTSTPRHKMTSRTARRGEGWEGGGWRSHTCNIVPRPSRPTPFACHVLFMRHTVITRGVGRRGGWGDGKEVSNHWREREIERHIPPTPNDVFPSAVDVVLCGQECRGQSEAGRVQQAAQAARFV